MTLTRKLKVLIAEDEVISALFLEKILEDNDCEIVGKGRNAEEVYKIMDYSEPDLILMDIKLDGDESGVDVIKTLSKNRKIHHAYCTAYSNEQIITNARTTNPDTILTKPVADYIIAKLVKDIKTVL